MANSWRCTSARATRFNKGDLLMQIDPRPYQVQLTQAEGHMAKDQATLENARVDLTRYEGLLKQNAIPEQQVANQRSTVKEAEATVKCDQGQVDSAKLNLTYSRITAPITGRLGLRLVDPGNIVHAERPERAGGDHPDGADQRAVHYFRRPVAHRLQKMRAGRNLAVEAFDREMKRRLATGVAHHRR